MIKMNKKYDNFLALINSDVLGSESKIIEGHAFMTAIAFEVLDELNITPTQILTTAVRHISQVRNYQNGIILGINKAWGVVWTPSSEWTLCEEAELLPWVTVFELLGRIPPGSAFWFWNNHAPPPKLNIAMH